MLARSSEVSQPRLGMGLRYRVVLLAAAGLLLFSGCASRVSKTVTVLGQREVDAGMWLVPELDRTALDVRQDGRGLLARAAYESRCWRMVRNETLVEEHRVTTERGEAAGVALTVAGALLVAGALDDTPAEGAGPMVLLGLGLTASGVVVLATAADSSEEKKRVSYLGLPRPLGLTSCSTGRIPARLELRLPDGTVLSADRNPTGLWRVPIDDAVWEKYGERIEADVLVDRVPVRRLVLTRDRT